MAAQRRKGKVVNRVFRAMFTRYNSLAYEFQDQTNAAKAPNTTELNKDMAETDARAKQAPKGSDAKVIGETKVEVAC